MSQSEEATNLGNVFPTNAQTWDDAETHRQGGAPAPEAEMLSGGDGKEQAGHAAAGVARASVRAGYKPNADRYFHLSSWKHPCFSYFFWSTKAGTKARLS